MKSILYILSGILLCSLSHANNIQVSNVVLTGQDIPNEFTLVEFDLSWENSWRINVGPNNWDAAWIFIKYKRNGGAWEHATLNYLDGSGTADGHTVPIGANVKTQSDQVGCFIYRSEEGSGTIAITGIQLRWNYGEDGVMDGDVVDVKVFAIEMIYIPQGDFYLGAVQGGSEVDNFYTPKPLGVQAPYLVNSEAEITIGTTSFNMYYEVVSVLNVGDQTGPVPASFPKGHNAFYIMKYEVSEDQWISFFNSLSGVQKSNQDLTDANHKDSDGVVERNTISWSAGGIATTSAPNRAVNYIAWENMAAYLDWTGLRPMTELEYEKACRGPNDPFSDELAWGTDVIFSGSYTISNDGTELALVTNPGTSVGNANWGITTPGGPMRTGIFAASAQIKNRVETGASYYGVMELSGNVLERCVSIGDADNRSFSGLHGDGEIDGVGNANVTNWNDANAFRGGSYFSTASDQLMVGDRYASHPPAAGLPSSTGLRGVRTAE